MLQLQSSIYLQQRNWSYRTPVMNSSKQCKLEDGWKYSSLCWYMILGLSICRYTVLVIMHHVCVLLSLMNCWLSSKVWLSVLSVAVSIVSHRLGYSYIGAAVPVLSKCSRTHWSQYGYFNSHQHFSLICRPLRSNRRDFFSIINIEIERLSLRFSSGHGAGSMWLGNF